MADAARTALITGAAGFCGGFLAEQLLAQGVAVVGVDRVDAPAGSRFPTRLLDLGDEDALRQVVAETRPDWIVHLAALTNPAAPLRELYEVNVFATIRLLEVVRAVAPACTVLIAGSSAQYGATLPAENPISEAQPFRPATHYAVSKATQDLVGGMAAGGQPVIRVRTFNIVGPRQSPAFVTASFARQIAEIEHGQRPPVIEVGNLAAQRDFVDVRDVARAYWLALARGEPGQVYNVCSGQARSIGALLEGLLALSRVPDIEVRHDPGRLQPADVPAQVGSYARLQADTGWRPEVPWEQSLRDLLEYWRGTVIGER